MATKCIDLTDDPRLTEGSLISLAVFTVLIILETALINMGFFYLCVVFFTWIFCNFVFQFSPRLVLLAIKVMFMMESRLSPTFDDPECILSEDELENFKRFKGTATNTETRFESLPT